MNSKVHSALFVPEEGGFGDNLAVFGHIPSMFIVVSGLCVRVDGEADLRQCGRYPLHTGIRM